MPFVFSADKAKSTGPEARIYNAKIASAKQDISNKDSEKPSNLMINIRWELEVPPDTLAEGERPPVQFDKLVFSQGTAWRIVQFIDAVGLPMERFEGQSFDPTSAADVAFVQELATDLLGEVASLDIAYKPDSRGPTDEAGQPRPDQSYVKKYLPYGSAKTTNDLLAGM